MSTHARSIENQICQPPETGGVMLLTFQQHPEMRLYRPVIFIGEVDKEETGEMLLGKWVHSMRRANVQGLEMYFTTYLERYGARHPQDPKRHPDDPLAGTVFTQRGTSGRIQTFTNGPQP
jgi:hypothetical protein